MQVAHFSKFLILKTNREKSFFTNHNNNNLQIILKYIEPCFNCKCPTCDINIKKDAIVYDDDSKYEKYILKFKDSHYFDNCDCPNCFIYKYVFFACYRGVKDDVTFENYTNFKQKYKDLFRKYIKENLQAQVEGIYFYTLYNNEEFNWSPRCVHFFQMNDGTFRVYKDLEFERYLYNKNENWEWSDAEYKNYFNIKGKKRLKRKCINEWKFETDLSIDELINYYVLKRDNFYKQFAKINL